MTNINLSRYGCLVIPLVTSKALRHRVLSLPVLASGHWPERVPLLLRPLLLCVAAFGLTALSVSVVVGLVMPVC